MSATPWNLLTINTPRFPVEDRIGYNVKTKKYEFVPQTTQERQLYKNPSDFFHVKWSMAYNKEYETGREVRLMVRFSQKNVCVIEDNYNLQVLL